MMQKVLLIFLFLFCQSFHEGSAILTKMACRVSGNGTCVDPFCFVTPVNNKTAAANFGCGKLSRPLTQLKIRQEFYFKLYRDYIPFNIFPEVELCSFLKNPNKFSFFYSILQVLNEKVPGLIHQCPYKDTDFQVRNLAPTTSDLALWITGSYKLVYTFYDDNDPQILQVSAKGVISRQ